MNLDLMLAETMWSRGFSCARWPYRDPLRGSLWVWFEPIGSNGNMVRLFESRLLAEYYVVAELTMVVEWFLADDPSRSCGIVWLIRASRDHGGLGWEPH